MTKVWHYEKKRTKINVALTKGINYIIDFLNVKNLNNNKKKKKYHQQYPLFVMRDTCHIGIDI